MKKRLMDMWSGELEAYTPADQHTPICTDYELTQFALTSVEKRTGTEYRDEYRIMALVYTREDGSQAIVLRPHSDEAAKNTIDHQPDVLLGTREVLITAGSVPQDAYQLVLADGTGVAAYLQHDGVTQADGSSKIYDNDGKGWADEAQMTEIKGLQEYQFAWPVRAGYDVPVSVTANNAGVPVPQNF
jgi:hypothetical protein